MVEVQTAPAVDSSASQVLTSSMEKDAMIARLDALLEQYLHTLDEYTKLTQQLSSQLSSGFFSLTQANFHNRSGVHYGQDSYDERVQATRKITVTGNEKTGPCFSTVITTQDSNDAEKTDADGTEHTTVPGTANPAQGTQDPPQTEDTAHADDAEESPGSSHLPDPIRMFGILVPPALRSAQKSFAEAVEGPVVKLVGVQGQLRALEREIGRARKGIRKA